MRRIRFAIFAILIGFCTAADIARAPTRPKLGPRCTQADMSPCRFKLWSPYDRFAP
jgi:hypothetical protein